MICTALLVAWFVLDFFVAPRLGLQQTSVFIWRLGWEAQALTAIWLLILVTHIAVKWPWGPSAG